MSRITIDICMDNDAFYTAGKLAPGPELATIFQTIVLAIDEDSRSIVLRDSNGNIVGTAEIGQ